MGKPHSADLRRRFVALLKEGLSASAASRRLLVARSTATRWGQVWRSEGRAEAAPMGGDRRSGVLEAHAPTILALVEARPDIFLHEIVAALAMQGVETSEDAVSRLLRRHGVTRKKRHLSQPNGSVRTLQKLVSSGART